MLATRSSLATSSENFSPGETYTLVLLERIGGSVSLVAVVLIFIAYALAPRVRNVQNTFIVFASVSNVGASIASVIAMDGIHAGIDSSLCQGQSFLFEMFMQSDPWWSLAMAINVFLVFFFRTSPDSFRKWWWLYCLICYGGPFIIALVLLLIKHPTKGPVYGGATIWCWVDQKWDDVRIYTYYMLIWICIVGSLLFYFLVGYHVFHSRNQLRSFSTSRSKDAPTCEHISHAGTMHLPNDTFYGTVVTEVRVIHSVASSANQTSEPMTAHMTTPRHVSFEEAQACIQPASSQYFSTCTSQPPPRTPQSPIRRVPRAINSAMNKFIIDDPIKRAYLRTSFLFALSVLVTWIPSSLNRIHSWLDGESPFEYHVATAAVLPLQGLWNAVIFFVTSSHGLKHCLRDRWGDSQDDYENEGGQMNVGNGMACRGPPSPDDRTDRGDSLMDDLDSRTMGSDVELRRMAESPGKGSPRL